MDFINRIVATSPVAQPVTALIKGPEHYQWFTYTGKTAGFETSKGGISLFKGDVFGVRKSANGNDIRLVLQEGGPNKVYTIDGDVAKTLSENCEAAFPTKSLAKPNRRTSAHLLKSLGMRGWKLDTSSKDLSKLVYITKPKFPYSAKTAAEVLMAFYKDAKVFRKIVREVDAYVLELKFSPTSSVSLILNTTGDPNHPPAEIWFEA